MSENSRHLGENAFTKAGWVGLDDVVANCLKRGRNGDDHFVILDFESGSQSVTLTPEQQATIGSIVDSVTEVGLAVQGIAKIIGTVMTDPTESRNLII